MKRLGKVLCLIIGVVILGFQGNEMVEVCAEETYTYKGVTYEYSSTTDGVVINGMVDDNIKYLEFPKEINGYNVIGINNLPNRKVSGIKVPEGYLFIGEGVFSDWYSLKSVELPESLTSIGERAFSNCIRLEEIVLPKSVVYVGDGVFNGCTSLLEIEVPEGVTYIGDKAFLRCYWLTKVTLPESLKRIGEGAFSDCKNLRNVVLPESLEEIGQEAFLGCKSLQEIELGPHIVSVGESAFKNSALEQIVIPNSVKRIGDSAFSECYSLMEVTLPENLECIGAKLFSDCRNLREITIPESVVNIRYGAFSGCSSLATIELPKGITEIRSSTFAGCTNLTEIVIPESVTSIGDSAFYGCANLTEITLPRSVVSIGESAFYKMGGASRTVYVSKNLEYVGNNAFVNCVVELPVDTRDGFISVCKNMYHIHVRRGSEAEKLTEGHMGIVGYWDVRMEPSCKKEGEMELTCVACDFERRAIPIEHEYEEGKINQEEACYIMINEGKLLKCLVCGKEAEHCFTKGECVGGSKIVAPIIREGTCDVCGVLGRWNDWSYVWVTGIVVVVLLCFVIAIINYMRRMKKSYARKGNE